jgi:hypothetical protein
MSTAAELRAELLQLREADQAARVDLAEAVSRNDVAFIRRVQESDSERQTRLKAIIAAEGWPTVALRFLKSEQVGIKRCDPVQPFRK